MTRDSRLVDLANLREFISHIEHLGIQKLYLQLIIEDKKEEADEIIAQHDDFLFCLRSLKNISPLLKQITAYIHTRQTRSIHIHGNNLGHQNAGCSQTLRYILRQIVLPV